RETRHRPQSTSRLRPALVYERRAQDPEDGGEHESGTATGAGTRRARPDQQQRLAAPLSRRARRLPRHPPLPPIPVAASPEIRGHQADSPGLRSPAHLRDLRAPCRNLDLRPFSLHGRQPDDDRPPLRPPPPRRTRARDQASRRVERAVPEFDPWTLVDARWTPKTPAGVTSENESDA